MAQERFVSYLRVSTAKQALSGLGIEAQREAVHQHLNSIGGILIAEMVEAESGAKDDRLKLAAALKTCREQKAKLLVAKLDRLARSVSFVSAVMDCDVPLVAADNPHASRLVLHMLAAVAEFEREQISARTRGALAAAKARGVRLGSNGAHLAIQHKLDAMKFAEGVSPAIAEGYNSGCRTLQQFADHLNRLSIPARAGGRWHAASVQRILSRLKA